MDKADITAEPQRNAEIRRVEIRAPLIASGPPDATAY